MIIPALHRQPVALDATRHRDLGLTLPIQDWSALASTNCLFVTAAELGQAANDYPVVFIRVTADGEPDYAPMAVLGLAKGENLYLESGAWRAQHLPSVMATYPLCVARLGTDRYAVCIDQAWPGIAAGAAGGQRLFDDAGKPTEFGRSLQADLERLEGQVEQTRRLGRRLAELDLLRERRLDAKLSDGRSIAVNGFSTVDEERLNALPDATILELHRDGVLAMIHAHWVSLGQMRRLLRWRVDREQAGPPMAVQPAPTP